ncbi:MAG: DUF3179 domain-containing (seleno)protein [Planctomycetota bacterium]
MTDADTKSRGTYWTTSRLLIAVLLLLVIGPSMLYAGRRLRVAYHVSQYQTDTDYYGFEFTPLDPLARFNDVDVRVDQTLIVDGGPPPHAIPSLTDPDVIAIGAMEDMAPDDRVVVVSMNGETRAYPIAILARHEIVNDTMHDSAFAVIFCPLCDSVSVCDRSIDGVVHEFRVSGLLMHSNVLAYDRADGGVWSQVAGMEAVCGSSSGSTLRHFDDWSIMSFETAVAEFPNATIMSFDTGHDRNYDMKAYANYLSNDDLIEAFTPAITPDGYLNKTPVIGIKSGDDVRAYVVNSIANGNDGHLVDTLSNGERIELAATVDGRVDIIEAPGDAIVMHTYWFAWRAFHPATAVIGTLPATPAVATSRPDA